MGLDMFARTYRNGEVEKTDLAYWRKHNALHGWFENLWEEKGRPKRPEWWVHDEYEEDVDGDVFNTIHLDLTKDDILRLQKDVEDEKLTPTDGFFFGIEPNKTNPKEREWFYQQKEYDLKFCTEALQAIDEGFHVAYYSWW